MLNEKANLLARQLQKRGIKPIKISKWAEFSDPSIWITESIYVQIGVDYTMVFRARPNDTAMYETSLDVNDVISKLKQAIDEGKPNK